MWFFPELHENKLILTSKILSNLNDYEKNFIQKYLPEKISLFKQLTFFQRNFIDIIQYIIDDKLFNPEGNKKIHFSFIDTSLSLKDPSIFNNFIEKFTLDDLKNKYSYLMNHFFNMLNKDCVSGNIEAAEKI